MTQRKTHTRSSAWPDLFSKTLLFLGLLLAFMPNQEVKAQEGINYSAKLDTNIIVIGDQINLELAVTQPKGITIDFPSFRDSITSHIEVVNQHTLDTIPQKDGRVIVKKNFLITSFDGGVHKIPPLEFTIHQQNYVNVIRTDSLALGVHTFEVDTTKGNFDIMMPYEAPVTFSEVAPWVFGGILLIGLIVFLIYYIRQRRRNKPLFCIQDKPLEPAHIIALRKLDEIKVQKLWQSGKVKEYHTQLTDAIRIYLEHRFGISTLECTSDEILENTRSLKELDKEQHANLADILQRADLVKFAKFQPLADENDRSLVNAYILVNKTTKEEVKEPEKQEDDPSDKNEVTYKTLK